MKSKKTEISKERTYQVVKRNDLIQRSRFDLSAQEQKIMLYIISKIKPGDDDFELYEFNIQDFCEVCNIDEKSGRNYEMLKDVIDKMSDKKVWVMLDNGYETFLRWIEKPYLSKRSGIIKIRLDKDMKPYLLQLKERYTSYSVGYILAMKSKYSIRLYELLKSYENLGECEFEIERLKTLLGAATYDVFANFKAKVLDIATREINDYSDISISYELEKQSRKFHRIKFVITPKYLLGIDECIKMYKNTSNRLEK